MIHKGYDIAVAKLSTNEKMNQIPITKDTYLSDIESEDLKVGSKIKVIGYL